MQHVHTFIAKDIIKKLILVTPAEDYKKQQ